MDFAERLIEKYAKNFDSIEIELSQGDSKSLEVRDGSVEDISINASSEMKVRVFKEGRILYYTAGGLSEERLDSFLIEAQDVIMLTGKDEKAVIPLSPEEHREDSSFPEPSIEELKNFAFMTEKGAKEFDHRITSVKSALCSYVKQNSLTIGTHINYKELSRQYISSFCHCLAEENNDTQEGYEGETVLIDRPFNPEFTGRKAAETAVSLLGGTALKTGKYNILFDSGTAAQFLELISEMCDAESVIKHMSLFEEKMGKNVASSVLTIWDDPLYKSGLGSYHFDDEGTKARLSRLINKGVLESFLHNSYTSNFLEVHNTANAVRTSSGKIGVSFSNLITESTAPSSDIALIEGDLVKVLDVMGLHTADTISGDFSIGISGVILRKGKIISAFRESILTGNLIDMLMSVSAVYDNIRTHGKIITGDILFKEMSISGS